MRLKTRTWISLGLVLFVASALWWQLAHQRQAASRAGSPAFALHITNAVAAGPAKAGTPNSPFKIIATNLPNSLGGIQVTNPFAYRLSNTTQPFEKLLRNDRALLLRNALIDTTIPDRPKIPEHLRARGDPGSYIVQARGAITPAFRERLTAAGAEIVSYIPNNAYLVRASEAVARTLSRSPMTQAVLPFEPYYKFDSRLLPLAVEKQLSPYPVLNIVAFPGTTASAIKALEEKGVEIVERPQSTPYGDVLASKVPAGSLAEVAAIAEVQLIGVRFEKGVGNDLTRKIVRISTNTIVAQPESHYGAPTPAQHLTGKDIMVAITDTGVDATHPDLTGRVISTNPAVLIDFDGHGTHVAGTFFGNGAQSLSVGSPDSPPTNSYARGSTNGAYFTGMAPQARAFVQFLLEPDAELQQNTALQDALISNNSWGYLGDNDYDIFAASYDAAVRDSLPGVTGEQQVMYVFACGNEGGGGEQGLNGIPGSVISPATAKNVISVGGSDLPRFITNVVVRACRDVTNGSIVSRVCETNRPWYGMTETNNQVSPYSSRGNVGIGVEGPGGRFKPDVVAPGSMLVSTRSKDYQEPQGSTNTSVFRYNSLTIGYPETNLYALTIPPNAIGLSIRTLRNAQSPTNLTLYIGAAIDVVPAAPTAVNRVDLTPPTLRLGTLYFTISNTNHPETVSYDLVLLLTVTNDVGDYFTVLQALNAPLKVGNQGYRYEAGTSMAAPVVSGFMACIQEFLGTNYQIRPSPALLKALVINGARSLSANYNLQVNAPVNHQGWGLVNMSNSVPSGLAPGATNGPMHFYDQSLTNSLATGGTETYEVTVPDEAKSYPLRITLVWTDPPGNPATTVKLVNDLNLYVTGQSTNVPADTNSQTEVNDLMWLGNNFPPGSDFTDSIITASNGIPVVDATQQIEATRDFVNNVENVYIRPPLASSYTVVVKGHRVNVNAVNSHSNSLAQDYALVISSGNVSPSNNVNLAIAGPVFTNDPTARIAVLARASNATSAGLLNQRVGANNPLIVSTNGASNQWSFFTYTNVPNPNFIYVAVITFYPQELSLPRYRQADIDLYVAHGNNAPDLFLLDDTAIAASTRSTTRGGTEMVLFTNAAPNDVFYIGVKSEDQQAANFSIFAVSSDKPFSSRDASNNIVAQAVPLPTPIPDGSPDAPGGTNLFALVFEPDVNIQRVYVTNRIYHEEAGDLIGILSHDDPLDDTQAAATLNNHRPWSGYENPLAPYNVVYDDSDQGDLGDDTSDPPVYPSDGPGSLRDFIGQQAFGVWTYTISDNALFHTGEVQELTLVIQPASTNNDDAVNLVADIGPLHWLYAGFRVPPDATNVQICVSETDGPVDVYVRRGALPTLTRYDKGLTNVPPPGACMNYGLDDDPPLSAGRYFVGVYNPSTTTPVHVHLIVTVQRGLIPDRTVVVPNDNITSIIDDATTNSTILVTNRGFLTSVEVDVRLDHPRIADLSLHLVSPFGTRLLLAENRGRDTTNGYGVSISNVVVTNFFGRVLDDGFEMADTNFFYYCNGNYPTGTWFSGWLVYTGNVDVIHTNPCGPLGLTGPGHTGRNAVDLNGLKPGSILTNVATTVGKEYLLSFAYCKHPELPTSPTTTGAVDVGTNTFTFSDDQLNYYTNLGWIQTSIVVRAYSNITPVLFYSAFSAQDNAGMYIDTIRMDEVQIVTNSLLYATFTDDTLKALVPIKFAVPPFGDTNFVSTNKFISGFEGTNFGVFTNVLIYTNGNLFTNTESYDDWRVNTNRVYVQTNDWLAYSDTNYLLLRTGSVTRVLSNTVQGKEYVLQFATKTARREIYSTGVDVDDLPLDFGELDSHYRVTDLNALRTNLLTFVLVTNVMDLDPLSPTPWLFDPTNDLSRWIGATNETNALGVYQLPGPNPFIYRTTFDLTGYETNSAIITGQFAADDQVVEVRLNGRDTGIALGGNGPSSFTPFVLSTNNPNLVPFRQRLNTLEFVVPNAATPHHGFRAEFGSAGVTANLQTNKDGTFVAPHLYFSAGQVRLAGCYTNYFTALSDEWRVQNVTFVAKTNNVLLQFTGITPGVWLDHIQIRETGRKYYLPEEPLTPLVGQQAFGLWKLEVWDNRLGALVSDSDLLSWRLNLNYVRTNPPFIRLLDNIPVTVAVAATNGARYFSFDVPCDEGDVTFDLRSVVPNTPDFLPLDLIFNQDTFPLTGGFGDFLLAINTTNTTVPPPTLTLDVGTAPLLRSGRFFLAVRNTNSVPVTFRLVVNASKGTPCTPVATPLVGPTGKASFGPNGFSLKWSASPNEQYGVQYANDPAGPWTELPQGITSPDGEFSFTDNGSQTGGLPQHRFYRLRRR